MMHNTEIHLTDAQQRAIEYAGGHLQIIACAGSGKTEVLSRRIANILKQGVCADQIIAFTFTEKAAESLKKRIEKAVGSEVCGMYVGTIHGFCKFILSKFTEEFANFKILDTVKNHLFLNRYSEHCGMSTLEMAPSVYSNNLYLQCIDKLIDDYDNRDNWFDDQRATLDQYIDCLYSHNYIDFSLLIFEVLRQIEKSESIQRYLKNIQHLIVDEYQDVNDLQEKLIGSIASFGSNVCVVGDDDQTIYRFRGSNAENMISFCDRYPNAYQIRLEDNFRCQKGIVDVAAVTIQRNKRRLKKQMNSGAEFKESIICAKGYTCSDSEYDAIADNINRIHNEGIPYRRIAVLARKGKHIAAIARKFDAKDVPYTADSAESFFDGNYFKRFVETVRILDSIDKALLYEQWQDIVNSTLFNIGFKYLRSCARGGNYRLSDILRTFCEKIDFLNEAAEDLKTRAEDLEGICRILDDYDEIYGDYQLSARISGLLRFLGTQAAQEYKYHNFRENDPDADVVQLMTIHKSKGLEFHTVFLPCLNKREFPVANLGGKKYYHILGGTFAANKSRYESDIEDERKLFYVALTRAEQNLYLSYTLANLPVSEFLADAAKSESLVMNRADLMYQPPQTEKSSESKAEERKKALEERRKQWEEERAKREAKRELVRYVRQALYEEYCVANRTCKGIILEYKDVCRQGPDAILAKAREWGVI